jgi:hypothetical protein
MFYTNWQLEEMKTSHTLAITSTKETTDDESPAKDNSWRLNLVFTLG